MVKKPSYLSKGALLLKRRRAGATGNGNEAPGGKETGTNPRGEIGKQRTIPKVTRERQRPPGTTLARAAVVVFTSAIHPPDGLSVAGSMRSAT